MDSRIFKAGCQGCPQQAKYLLDCQCLLCADCFRERVVTLYLLDASPIANTTQCKFCQEPTILESLNIHTLSESKRWETLCNFYAINCYLKFKKGLLAWVAALEQTSLESIRELSATVSQLQSKEEVYSTFVRWCIAKYKVNITDVDPQVLIKDKQKLLRPFFFGEEIDKSLLEPRSIPFGGLDDTRKKDPTSLLGAPHPFAPKINEILPLSRISISPCEEAPPCAISKRSSTSVMQKEEGKLKDNFFYKP